MLENNESVWNTGILCQMLLDLTKYILVLEGQERLGGNMGIISNTNNFITSLKYYEGKCKSVFCGNPRS